MGHFASHGTAPSLALLIVLLPRLGPGAPVAVARCPQVIQVASRVGAPPGGDEGDCDCPPQNTGRLSPGPNPAKLIWDCFGSQRE